MQIVGAGVICAVLAVTVRRQSPEMAMMVSIAACVLIFVMLIPLLSDAFGVLSRIGGMLDGGVKYISLTAKVIGVAYMAELGASVCHDAGEGAVAAKIDLAGRVIILVLASPVILDIVGLLTGMLP